MVFEHFWIHDHCLCAIISSNSYCPRRISSCFDFHSSYDVGFLSSLLSFWHRCCMCSSATWLTMTMLSLALFFFFFFLIIPSHTRLILYYLRHVILSSFKIELREETNTFMSRSYYRSYILTPFVIVIVIAINNVLLILGVCIIVDIYTFLSLMKMTLSPSFFPSLIMHASF